MSSTIIPDKPASKIEKIPTDFNESKKSKVAILKTDPDHVLFDIARLMKMADFESALPHQFDTILKINISWHYYYPACSTTPWQFDGVVRTLKSAGYKNLIPAQNRTVVVDPKLGSKNNHLESVLKNHDIDFAYLYEDGYEWFTYEPQKPLLVLDKVYPKGFKIPRLLVGKNAVHLPTVKTHVFTTTTGAMKNAFGGLLHDNRHWTHRVIHETLVDLLQIQQEIHPGLFAVMDGTIAGEGPGPRCMLPRIKNYILASADQVAIDAVAAKMMGFDPLSIKYIRLAHEKGLGCGNIREMDIIGEDLSKINFHFSTGDTLASRGQKLIYWGSLQKLEHFLLRTPLIWHWSRMASYAYHDYYWYPVIGKRRVNAILDSNWGKLFQSYKK